VQHHGAVTRGRQGGLLLLVAVIQVVGIRTGGATPSRVGAAVASAAGLGQVLLLLRLRRRPVPCAAGVIGLYAVQVAAVDVVLPATCCLALWWLATGEPDRVRALRATAVGVASTLLVIVAGELLHPGPGASAAFGALVVVVALAALLRRSEQARLAAVRAEGAVAERLRIARDLHDLAGHGLSAVAVQSSTARLALDAGDQAAARRALDAVESSSRAALKEMRELLTVLRDPEETGSAPLPGLADVPALVDGLIAGGVEVRSSVTSQPVPPAVQLTAYRVVQEALTNAVRHARGSAVDVDVHVEGEELLIAVVSDGAAAPPREGASGVEGMRTRVAAAGGELHAGPTDRGWRVEVTLPMAGR